MPARGSLFWSLRVSDRALSARRALEKRGVNTMDLLEQIIERGLEEYLRKLDGAA